MPEPTACLTPSESERRIAAAREAVAAWRNAESITSADVAGDALAALVESWLPPVESGEGTAVGALGVEGEGRARPE